jgi:vesicle-associated membrane protein-associated protein A
MAREESQEAPAYDESITQEHEPPHRPETPVHVHETPIIITHEQAPAEETLEVPVQQEPVLMPAPVSAPPPFIVKENPVNEELYAKFMEAEREIDRLRSTMATMAAAPPQLRQRTRALSDSGSTAETDIQTMGSLQQEGVPLQVVVIIALGVFITTYLFF